MTLHLTEALLPQLTGGGSKSELPAENCGLGIRQHNSLMKTISKSALCSAVKSPSKWPTFLKRASHANSALAKDQGGATSEECTHSLR